MRILLVDDDPEIRLVGRLALSAGGRNEVLLAGDGPQGLEMARARSPDVVVLDAFMDGMDGPEVLRALRAGPQTAGLPVVFLTARTAKEDVESLVSLGALGVLPKPFDPASLLSRLEAILRAR